MSALQVARIGVEFSMVNMHRRLSYVLAAGALAAGVMAAFWGCANASETRVGPMPANTQDQVSRSMHPALRGTIGEFAILLDATSLPVEGYGVVAGLANSGSGEMDPKIRELLINRLVIAGAGLVSNQTQDFVPERILQSDQIAAVEVRGLIPPLARKGTTFDLYVNALPNSGATSLANGLLWTSDLKVRGLTLDGTDSATIAMGRGPVFISAPVETVAAGAERPADVNAPRALRTGRVIAGGVCAEDRPARLQLFAPSYRMTAAIERAINARFPARDKTATAENDLVVSLRIPREYADNPMDFVEVCKHLFLTGDTPGFNEIKARELVEALQQPGAPHRSLSLALQGLGRSVLPDYIQPHYTARNAEVRFWTARAGANLQDVAALTILQETIRDASSAFRKQAILALIEACRGRDTERATLTLVDLLRSFNTEDRILAYHGLLAIRSRAVESYLVGRKFVMDIVPADSPPLIYVLQVDSPRVAFIGRPLRLPDGALYISEDRYLTVNVETPSDIGDELLTDAAFPTASPAPVAGASPAENVTLFWRSPLGDRTVKLRTTQDLPQVVARATWIPDAKARDFDPKMDQYIGASFQRVTEMLASLCADRTLEARFVLQKAPSAIVSPTDLVLGGRPEGSTLEVPPPPPIPAESLDGGMPLPGGM